MSKIWTVTTREYLVNVKKPSFWVVTIGLPFFIIITMALMTSISYFVVKSKISEDMAESLPMKLGIIDHTGLIDFSKVIAFIC